MPEAPSRYIFMGLPLKFAEQNRLPFDRSEENRALAQGRNISTVEIQRRYLVGHAALLSTVLAGGALVYWRKQVGRRIRLTMFLPSFVVSSAYLSAYTGV